MDKELARLRLAIMASKIIKTKWWEFRKRNRLDKEAMEPKYSIIIS
jgi:hypothetical protein